MKKKSILLTAVLLTAALLRAEAPAHDFRDVIAAARAKVQPAVLYVKCVRDSMERGTLHAQEVAGSAFLISPGGEFVTNAHVVNKARSVRCLLSDGRHFDADILGIDKSTDLALCKLRLPEGESVPFARLGTSAGLSEGDFVIALGAPWGMNRTLTFGTISCAQRYLEGHSEYVLWLQTDASIGPGNSGGPLVNTEGEVIGVNALGSMLPTANFGFAIPSDEAGLILGQLREHGQVNWSWCGIQLQPLNDFNRNTFSTATNGVFLAGTLPNSPARGSDLRAGDRIISVNGKAVNGLTEETLPALRREIGLLSSDAEIVFELMRGDDRVTVTLSPKAKGAVEGEEKAFDRWDFTAKTINRFETPELFLRRETGVYVFGVAYPGNAQNADLREKDIITSINNRPIATLTDLEAAHTAALEKQSATRKTLISVIRNGRPRQIVLDFAREYER